MIQPIPVNKTQFPALIVNIKMHVDFLNQEKIVIVKDANMSQKSWRVHHTRTTTRPRAASISAAEPSQRTPRAAERWCSGDTPPPRPARRCASYTSPARPPAPTPTVIQVKYAPARGFHPVTPVGSAVQRVISLVMRRFYSTILSRGNPSTGKTWKRCVTGRPQARLSRKPGLICEEKKANVSKESAAHT